MTRRNLKNNEGETQRFFQKVYAWMFFGLLISALAAYLTISTPSLLALIFGSRWIFFGLIILELGLVIYLSAWIKSMSAGIAKLCFILYSFITGLTLSVIFIVYEISSIAFVFFLTAGLFGLLSLYGYVTKRDLTSLGTFLFIGLIGIILASLFNLFLQSSQFNFIISILGVIIFMGLTAYDVQKIKEHNVLGNEGTDEDTKESILGALTLYLDFINLFLHLLQLMGKRK